MSEREPAVSNLSLDGLIPTEKIGNLDNGDIKLFLEFENAKRLGSSDVDIFFDIVRRIDSSIEGMNLDELITSHVKVKFLRDFKTRVLSYIESLNLGV